MTKQTALRPARSLIAVCGLVLLIALVSGGPAAAQFIPEGRAR
jgi:hypothetical protein